jgi:hypothetical protein
VRDVDVLFGDPALRIEWIKAMHPVERLLASIAERILDEGIIYDCPWDDFRFNYLRGKDDWTASRELVARVRPLGIKVEFERRRECDVEVFYVLLKARRRIEKKGPGKLGSATGPSS